MKRSVKIANKVLSRKTVKLDDLELSTMRAALTTYSQALRKDGKNGHAQRVWDLYEKIYEIDMKG